MGAFQGFLVPVWGFFLGAKSGKHMINFSNLEGFGGP